MTPYGATPASLPHPRRRHRWILRSWRAYDSVSTTTWSLPNPALPDTRHPGRAACAASSPPRVALARFLRVLNPLRSVHPLMHMTRTSWPTEPVIKAAQDGDVASLAAVISGSHPHVHRFAGSLCASPQDAEDAAQEALIILYRKIGTLRASSALAAAQACLSTPPSCGSPSRASSPSTRSRRCPASTASSTPPTAARSGAGGRASRPGGVRRNGEGPAGRGLRSSSRGR